MEVETLTAPPTVGTRTAPARHITRTALVALIALAALFVLLRPLLHTLTSGTFTNPILRQGEDPSIVYWHGSYYLVQSEDNATRIVMYRSATLTGIASGEKALILSPICCDLWAPELVPLDGRWYIYYTASQGDNASHRMYVLESVSGDPLGPYHTMGRIAATTDDWAIDGTVLRMPAANYFIWSGWPGTHDGLQNLYIAPMSNPWTIRGDRFLLSTPTSPWEHTLDGSGINLEEGPEILRHNGRIFLVYSTRGSWTDDYCLGMLSYIGGDVTNSASWVKSSGCVFAKNPAAHVFGPGHNSFTQSPDGRESWIVYHADAISGAGWAGRSVRAQKFTWNRDGTPNFGEPVATGTTLPMPSDEPGIIPLGW